MASQREWDWPFSFKNVRRVIASYHRQHDGILKRESTSDSKEQRHMSCSYQFSEWGGQLSSMLYDLGFMLQVRKSLIRSDYDPSLSWVWAVGKAVCSYGGPKLYSSYCPTPDWMNQSLPVDESQMVCISMNFSSHKVKPRKIRNSRLALSADFAGTTLLSKKWRKERGKRNRCPALRRKRQKPS